MAKTKKRSTKSSARNKPAAKRSAAAKKAAKKAAAKRAPAPKKTAIKKAAPKSTSPVAKKTPARSSAAKPSPRPVKHVEVKPQRPEPSQKTAPQGDLPPDTKKKLAAQHMWDLVQAKKQRATQTPSWQTIEHHDHPAPRTSPDLSSDQGGTSMPSEMPGHRDRGTG